MGKNKKDKKDDDPLIDLPPGSLQILASLLAFPPAARANDFYDSQRKQIKKLGRETGLVKGPTMQVFFSMDRFGKHKLCKDHDRLRPELMAWILLQLAKECSIRVDRWRNYQRQFGEECPEAIKDYINRLSGIPSLWMKTGDFEDKCGHDVPEECTFERVKGGCSACVLSVVGARAQMLVDLRANMLARTIRASSGPRLQPLVEAWIDVFKGRATGRFLRDESEALSVELIRIRDFMHEYNAQKRKAERLLQAGKGKMPAYYKREKSPTFMQKTINLFRPKSSASTSSSKPGSSSGATESPNTSFASDPRFDPYDTDGLNAAMGNLVLGPDGRAVSRDSSYNPDLDGMLKSPSPSLNRYPNIPERSASFGRDRSVFRGRRSDLGKDAADMPFRRPPSRSPPRDIRRPFIDDRPGTADSTATSTHVDSSESEDDGVDDTDNLGFYRSDFTTLSAYETAMKFRWQARVEAKTAAKEERRAARLKKQQEEEEQARRDALRAPSVAASSVYSQDNYNYDDEAEDQVGDLPTFSPYSGHGKSRSSSRYSLAPSDMYETIAPDSPPGSPPRDDEEFTIPPSPSDVNNPYSSVTPSQTVTFVHLRQQDALHRLNSQINRNSYVDVNESTGMPDMPSLARRMEDDPFNKGEEEGWETDILEKERRYIRRAKRDGSINPGTRFRDVARDD